MEQVVDHLRQQAEYLVLELGWDLLEEFPVLDAHLVLGPVLVEVLPNHLDEARIERALLIGAVELQKEGLEVLLAFLLDVIAGIEQSDHSIDATHEVAEETNPDELNAHHEYILVNRFDRVVAIADSGEGHHDHVETSDIDSGVGDHTYITSLGEGGLFMAGEDIKLLADPVAAVI